MGRLLISSNLGSGKRVTKKPKNVVMPIVKEFYANVPNSSREETVLVRGQLVSYSSKTINRYYKLKDISNDGFTSFFFRKTSYGGLKLKEDLKEREMIDLLCKPGSSWNVSRGSYQAFPMTIMSKESRFWHYFICARLMPTTSNSIVHLPRALLNFAIQSGLSINIGRIIHGYIKQIYEDHTIGLASPDLVTDLCADAGVRLKKTK